MNRHSIRLIGFELSLFAIIVLLNYYNRTKNDKDPLDYARIKVDEVVIKKILNNGTNSNKTLIHNTPINHSTKIKTNESFNQLVNAKDISRDTPDTFIWISNRCTSILQR
jgi:hypothetical protein